MSKDNDLLNLIGIIERLEISARKRARELYQARQIIQRLQNREVARSVDESVSTASPLIYWDHFVTLTNIKY